MADTDKLRQGISEILDTADLNTITAKKVRQQLEEKLGLDLIDRKKEIDQMVMEILEERQKSEEEEEDAASSEEETKPKSKSRAGGPGRKRANSDSEDDYAPAKKGKAGKKKGKGSDSDASDEDWGKQQRKARAASAGSGAAKKKRGGGGGGGGGTGFTKTLKLSPELSSVMGTGEMARHEVVKRIWAIIKEKNLYDPKNKQFAICNEELLPVFGVKRFRTFGMMKHLKNHFIN